jgi:hypothetical protein
LTATSRLVAFEEHVRRFGVWPAICRAVSRRQHPVLGYVRYLCLLLPADADPPATPALPDGFSCREIDVSELEPLIGVPESNVRGKDLERARAENHRCIGIFAGGQLASYSLNAPASTWFDDTFRLEFPHGWLYHYMAVTLPPWHGKRLHGAQVAAVLRGVARARGIVTLVSSINYPSRASFHRLGFRKSRSFVVLGHPRRQVLIWGRNAGPFGLVRHSS